jgi:acyl carrier protein
MNTIDDFLALISEEIGLPVTARDAGLDLEQIAGWDSVHLLSLVTLLERRTGRSIPFADVLEATNLRDIYSLAVAR